jgi:hypothetical protein
MQEFEALAHNIGELARQTRDIATRPRQARDETGTERVRHRNEYDWDDRCRLLCRKGWWSSRGDNDVDLLPGKLNGNLDELLRASLRPARLDRDGVAIDPTKFAQPLYKRRATLAFGRRCGPAQSQVASEGHLGVPLRAFSVLQMKVSNWLQENFRRGRGSVTPVDAGDRVN